MTKEEAFNLIVQVTGMVQTDRDGHEKIKQALFALRPEQEVENDNNASKG